MGNMELLQHGSRQFHPSSEDFDSGVDDLENPREYIVWNMNMNTHIYPEFVVSFKFTPNSEGDMLLLLEVSVLAQTISTHTHVHACMAYKYIDVF